MPPSTTPQTLVLVPTALEQRELELLGGFPSAGVRAELCGFGAVAAAARSAELVARLAPRRVLLLGIAGSFDPRFAPLGSATAFGEVLQDGIGAGSGPEFLPPSRLGLPQWAGPPAVDESLRLAGGARDVLLSVCAASSSAAERTLRRERYPRALAEDMEGFGVALACRLAGVPLAIVRGFANEVGTRDKRAWRIAEALSATRTLALAWLERTHWEASP